MQSIIKYNSLVEQIRKGYSYRNLQLAKKFYNTFPIVQSLIAQSDTATPPIEKALLSNKKQSLFNSKQNAK